MKIKPPAHAGGSRERCLFEKSRISAPGVGWIVRVLTSTQNIGSQTAVDHQVRHLKGENGI
ncbi:MAG TPA: hypothetical protein VIO61_07835 [Anaerolineaceae bacterium]